MIDTKETQTSNYQNSDYKLKHRSNTVNTELDIIKLSKLLAQFSPEMSCRFLSLCGLNHFNVNIRGTEHLIYSETSLLEQKNADV